MPSPPSPGPRARHAGPRHARPRRRRRPALHLGLAFLGALVLAAIGLGVASGRLTAPLAPPPRASSAGPSASAVAASGPRCPLSDEPAPGGVVPARPALAIKVGNNPSARPQSGLSEADIVYEEPIEGAITRLLAVFQCHGAPQVGPVRSTRWIDVQLLEQFGHPVFGFAGGIDPDEALVRDSPVVDANFLRDYDLYYRTDTRLAPNNLYVATASLWGLDDARTPPAPVFSFSTSLPKGLGATTTASATLTWSSIYDVTWTWDPPAESWLRAVNGTADLETSGRQLQAANVVILRVKTVPGPYSEDAEGDVGVHSITVGEGPLTVLRNGVAIHGIWQRGSIQEPIRLLSAAGTTIPLAPGPTWVELLPTTGQLQLAGG
ncbi:DUF3048 domain-containing protein [Aciditerrimonas ferrireducens]|uniref:DUF3048 domain-containing protein n=1 Tax=Aciditerrimonas ferrireducens TaxID=667306 RepID=A0ABV6BYX0_9ACTN